MPGETFPVVLSPFLSVGPAPGPSLPGASAAERSILSIRYRGERVRKERTERGMMEQRTNEGGKVCAPIKRNEKGGSEKRFNERGQEIIQEKERFFKPAVHANTRISSSNQLPTLLGVKKMSAAQSFKYSTCPSALYTMDAKKWWPAPSTPTSITKRTRTLNTVVAVGTTNEFIIRSALLSR